MTGLGRGDRTDRSDRIEMMSGQLDDFDLLTLLQTIGLGRQLVEIEVSDRNGHLIGRVVAKSGKIVAASAGRTRGLEAISQLTRSPISHRFAVYRRSTGAGFLPELATISELNLRFAQGTGELPRTVLLEGDLSEFDLGTVMQSVGTSRQFCAIEIEIDIDGGQSTTGTVFIKAGNIVSATAGPMSGLAAIHFLLAAPPSGRFRVMQLPHTAPGMNAIGPVDEILHAEQPMMEPPAVHAAPNRPSRGSEATRIEVPRGVAAQMHSPPPAAAPPPAEPQRVVIRPRSSTAQRVGSPRASTTQQVPTEYVAPVPHVPAGPQRVAAPTVTGRLVMEGQLSDFDIRTLLHVLSATRQQVCLQIGESGRGELGEVRLKAGWILSSQAGVLRDKNALAMLLGAPKQLRFGVVLDDEPLPDEPLGRVDDLFDSIRTGRESTPEMPVAQPPPTTAPTKPTPWRTLRWAMPAALAIGAAAAVAVNHRLPSSQAPAPAQPPVEITQPTPAAVQQPSPPTATPPTIAVSPPLPTTATDTPAATPTPPLPTTAADVAAATAAPPPAAAAPVATPAEPPAAEAAPAAAPAPELPQPRHGNIKAAQSALTQLGERPGPIDNVYGPQTRAAVLRFQRTHHLPQTGLLDQDTWAAIVVELTR